MPQIFKVGPYLVYFWINEGLPLEPVHVHISEKTPEKNGTKVWITKSGNALLCSNSSKIPEKKLQIILNVIESQSGEIIDMWIEKFGEIKYYC